MRIAICISGHMRFYRDTAPSFHKYILEPLRALVANATGDSCQRAPVANATGDSCQRAPVANATGDSCQRAQGAHVDIFIHTYNILGTRTQYGSGHSNVVSQIKLDIPHMLDTYKPTAYVVELFEEVQNAVTTEIADYRTAGAATLSLGPFVLYNAVSMYRKIHACHELAAQAEQERGSKYDIIIRMRPDMLFTKPIDTDLLIQCLGGNRIAIPAHNVHDNLGTNGGYIDHWAFGSSAVMRHYASCYTCMPVYNTAGLVFSGERLLKHHLHNNMPNMRVIEYDVGYTIPAADYLHTQPIIPFPMRMTPRN